MKPLKYWKGVSISEEDRNRLATDMINHSISLGDKGPKHQRSMTGDSLVLVERRSDGGFDVYDCLVRRTNAYTR